MVLLGDGAERAIELDRDDGDLDDEGGAGAGVGWWPRPPRPSSGLSGAQEALSSALSGAVGSVTEAVGRQWGNLGRQVGVTTVAGITDEAS